VAEIVRLSGAGLLRLAGLLEDDARPEVRIIVVGQVLAGDSHARGRLAGRGLGPVLVDALYRFLQVDPGGQDELAGDAEAEFAGCGVAGAAERVVRPEQRLADEVFRQLDGPRLRRG
jgi:hypothetical protein